MVKSGHVMQQLPKRRAILALAGLMTSGGILSAQTPANVMELNRSGKWEEAATAARAALTAPMSPLERCETRAQLTYALARLRRDIETRAEGAAFESECKNLPADHWARREVAQSLASLAVRSSTVNPPVAAGPSRDDDWVTADPHTSGVDTAVLRAHRSLCDRSGADACVVVHNGYLVDEWYGPRYAEPMMAMSSTKSITGLLVGLLIDDGRLSLDDPVARFIPQWRAGSEANVTVRHLLTMTSGLPDDRSSGDVGTITDKQTFAFGRRLVTRPGHAWAYTNNGVFLLSPLIERAAGEPVADYARRRLFAPLGMHRTRMHVYPEGQAWTHADMETTPRDLARIGQLMLNGGKWNGRRVISEAWVRESTRKSQAFVEYGLLWWLDVPNGFAARGYLDTNLYVFPDRDLVVVRMQARPAAVTTDYEAEAKPLFANLVRR